MSEFPRLARRLGGIGRAARILDLSVCRTRQLDPTLCPEFIDGKRLYDLDHVERVAAERAAKKAGAKASAPQSISDGDRAGQ